MGILEQVAKLMELSAHTAPKVGGKDYIDTRILTGDLPKLLANEMIQYGVQTGRKNYDRDANSVLQSDAVLLVALKDSQPVGLNCGACGFDQCKFLQKNEGSQFAGGICAWRLIDLGAALGLATKTASMLNVDNKIMYRVGVVARAKGFIGGQVVVGIPLEGGCQDGCHKGG